MYKALLQGADVHRSLAATIYKKEESQVTKLERQMAKSSNFGFGYGMGGKRFIYQNSRDLFLEGVCLQYPDGQTFWEAFHQQYEAIHRWHKTAPAEAYKTRQVRTLSGRKRVWDTNPKYSEILNTPSQGTGADIMKEILVRADGALRPLGGKVILTVHDEVLAEVPADRAGAAAPLLKDAMEAAAHWIAPIPVPVDVVIADSWAEKA